MHAFLYMTVLALAAFFTIPAAAQDPSKVTIIAPALDAAAVLEAFRNGEKTVSRAQDSLTVRSGCIKTAGSATAAAKIGTYAFWLDCEETPSASTEKTGDVHAVDPKTAANFQDWYALIENQVHPRVTAGAYMLPWALEELENGGYNAVQNTAPQMFETPLGKLKIWSRQAPTMGTTIQDYNIDFWSSATDCPTCPLTGLCPQAILEARNSDKGCGPVCPLVGGCSQN